MLTIINDKTDPLYNLALEEYVLKQLTIDDDFLLVWQSTDCVVVGRNQNAYNDINAPFVREKNIPVLRRISSGDAVFHDLGTLNFSFITRNAKQNFNHYDLFLDPIVELLKNLGIETIIKDTSDLYWDGFKISENYQSFHKNKSVHHGTIYFDTNLELSHHCLLKSEEQTTNIKPHLKRSFSINEFKTIFLNHMLEGLTEEHIYKLDYIDQTRVMSLMREKYKSWDWNYGESPEFIVKAEYDYRMMVTLLIKEGYIKDITIDSYESTIKLEKALLGIKYDESIIRTALKEVPKIDIDIFVKTIFN
ncbi:MAG: lipoate--protein ligase [Bacilli bacterium]|nr:lipoate--protein ligase [Bacilli bacterium]